LHREIFMPRPRLVDSEFRNECIHLRVELDHPLVRGMMIASQRVARRVPAAKSNESLSHAPAVAEIAKFKADVDEARMCVEVATGRQHWRIVRPRCCRSPLVTNNS